MPQRLAHKINFKSLDNPVTLDSSATHSFTQIKQAADNLGARLVIVNLSPALTSAFHNINFISKDILVFPELDRAREACENAIIAAYRNADGETRSLRDWLAEALGNAELAELLASQCQRFEFGAGDIIAHQGAPADSMHFVLEGRVGIIVNLGNGRSVRVRSLGPHTTVGEMGLITGRTRSATVQAEIASVAYELRAEAFERLKTERPPLAQALFTFVIGVMAERLSFSSKVIGVLQRLLLVQQTKPPIDLILWLADAGDPSNRASAVINSKAAKAIRKARHWRAF